ncbi:MAG: Wzz/FepE/Etk N-terminal domain-containing protein [Geminocystis sp.]|nr:Wzz/FepE/Etk N-terminal domain-containing protein [Geminocystis sp.]MCS7146848.1 Wzz/FepE/Etk N-terminal domain-containing protein [Geminocystis sp.]MDW8115673.1 Wzz/FepE/Etk N-terminal domain-containing protein [Geminocystis sp.]MDW8463216.1 Wzz/FepE/Etk N-terminal domain-containing protein [Geminocystis sp.]HIK38471.1 AAA family ATPase [Geminocystis sp. M7585_C2015_104]
MSKKLPPFPGKYPHNYSDSPFEDIPDYLPRNLQPNSSRNLEIAENFESEESSDELSFIWQLFKRRWLIILFTTLGMTVGAHWLSMAQTPIYEGKFLLLIEKEEKTLPPPQTTNADGLQINPTRTIVDYSTEIQILGSPTVLAPILKEIATRYPDIYRDIDIQNLDKLNIRQIVNTKIIEVSFRHQDKEKINFVLNTIAKHYLKNGLNPGGRGEGVKFINQQISAFQNRVAKIESKIENLRRKYQFIDPQIQAKELTQQLIAAEKEYLTTDIQLKQAQVAYENLQKQLNMTPKEAIAVNDLTESPRYQALLQQLQQVELEIANKSAIFTDESPQILTLKEQKENILKLLEEEKAKYPVKTEQNNSNVGYSQIRAKLTQDLLKVENDIKILKSRKEGLTKLLEGIRKRINQLPSVAREYTELQRELNYTTDSLKRFMEAKEKLEIQESQRGKDAQLQLISPPQVSDKPVSALPFLPIPPWLLGLLGGLTVGITIAAIIDKLDGTVYNVPQLKTITRIPILGAIPLDKSISWTRRNRPIFTSNFPGKTITETGEIIIPSSLRDACQHLLANLSLLLPDYECNLIVVTSPQPEEGKSTVSLNLAKTAAKMGKRVILVDANLRLPRLHQLAGVENEMGLRNILAGETKWEEVIIPMGKNLSLITAGGETNGVNQQDGFFPFLSTSLSRWVGEVKACGKFDLVIYDTPAFLNFFETKIIASHCDGILLVMRMGKSQYNHLTQVCEQLRLANARLLGIVANGVN